MARWSAFVGSVFLIGSAGCESPPPPDPSQPTAAEIAACDNLVALGCDPGRTRETCAAQAVDLRLRAGQPPCNAAYDAFVDCLRGVTECLSTPGVFCPEEYGTLAACGGGGS